jgi:hypothetical protein
MILNGSAAHVLLNLKKPTNNPYTIDPGTQKKLGMLSVIKQLQHFILCNIIQLLHLNEINMRFHGAEYNNIERGEAEFNIVVLCSMKPHIDQVQV